MNNSEHWNRIFETKSNNQLGWFEPEFTQTEKLLTHIDWQPGQRVIIAGAGTSRVAQLFLKEHQSVLALDISETALNMLSHQLSAENQHNLQTRCCDLGERISELPNAHIWFDRAALHFLISEKQIQQYFDNVRTSVLKNGYVLLAQFSKQGAEKCAGLPIHQYDADEMQLRLGNQFTRVTSEDYQFINPFGESRAYVYALFQRTKD